MTHAALTLSLAITLLAVAPDQGSQRQTDSRSRDIYVSVLDDRGDAVTGLTAADFTVREDGVAREVLKAAQATEQMAISLLIDDSQASTPAIQQLRDGITGFVDALQGKAEIAMATFGERPTSVVDYTTSAAALKKGVGTLFARPASGAYLLEAIVEVSRGLAKREPARPIIVVVMMEAVEFSNLHYETVLEELAKSRATLHVLAIGTPSASQEDEIRNRNLVVAEGTSRTGGRRDQVLAISAIPQKMKQLGDELLKQYVVTYGRPETLIPPEKVEVSVTRPGLTVRAPRRVAGS